LIQRTRNSLALENPLCPNLKIDCPRLFTADNETPWQHASPNGCAFKVGRGGDGNIYWPVLVGHWLTGEPDS
jgi:hypothetical protein